MRLIMLGPPGAGKGTQSKLLSKKFNIPQISTGDILRAAREAESPLGLKVKEILSRGDLVSDDIVNQLVREKITSPECENGFILDGYPRTLGQANTLDYFLKEMLKYDLRVVSISVPRSILINRLANRRKCNNCNTEFNLTQSIKCPNCSSEDLFQRKDDNAETIAHRLALYEEETKPLIEYYEMKKNLFHFNGNEKVDILLNKIIEKITL